MLKMTLDQLRRLEGIDNYYIWWYGASIKDIGDYLNDDGLAKEIVDVARGAQLCDRVYIILNGIDGHRAKYMFAVRLTENVNYNNYKWEKVPLSIDQYCGRMVFRCNRKFSFYNSRECGKDFEVESISPLEQNRTVEQFRDYESVELSFMQLKEVVDNEYVDYYEHLVCVKAVYMIIDGNTGKLYVGSAYDKDETLWARWRTYANTYHGNNLMLKELYNAYGPEYFEKFKYIILQIFPKKTSNKEIIEAESRYKNRFLTRECGLNQN